MSDLAAMKCEPCQGGVPPLARERVSELLGQLSGWGVEKNHHLVRGFPFPDFVTALAFVNKVGALAEAEGHHPDISLGWGYAAVVFYTHKISGLHENDFIMAAKTTALLNT